VLAVFDGPVGKAERLRPVAALCWHVHQGNWPLTVLDLGYRIDLDEVYGRALVEQVLLPALGELNDREELRDTDVPRPSDTLGWAVRREDGAGSDPQWARAVATRAQADWGFVRVTKRDRPGWAVDGFYGSRQR